MHSNRRGLSLSVESSHEGMQVRSESGSLSGVVTLDQVELLEFASELSSLTGVERGESFALGFELHSRILTYPGHWILSFWQRLQDGFAASHLTRRLLQDRQGCWQDTALVPFMNALFRRPNVLGCGSGVDEPVRVGSCRDWPLKCTTFCAPPSCLLLSDCSTSPSTRQFLDGSTAKSSE